MIYDAILVGAGPAGSAAAATLAQRGRRVLVLEKERFPRRKVCGAFLSGDAGPSLDRLGVKDALLARSPETITEGSVHLPAGASVGFRLQPPALGVSRALLDDLLARRAREAGADIRFEARVLSAARVDGLFRVTLLSGTDKQELEARSVIGSWGRWDTLDRTLHRSFLRGHRFFGWSADFRGGTKTLNGRVRLYLFRGGYCGLSRVEGDTVNLAGVVSDRARSGDGPGWQATLDRARRDNRALDLDLASLEPGPGGFLGTGPLFFTAKPPVEDGMLMAGDAAGVLDPFSGQGQSAALASGILAAETIDAALSGAIPLPRAGEAYERAWKRRFARRFGWSRLFRRLMLSPTLASVAARLAGEGLIRLGMEKLQNQSGDRTTV